MAIDPIPNPRVSANPGFAADLNSTRKALEGGDKRAQAEKVASQLEGVFMEMMMKAMRSTVQEDGLFGKSMGGSNYIEMLDQHYAQLQGIPRDPRFHEVLVSQIMKTPDATNEAMQKMREGSAQSKTASLEQAQRNLMP